MNKTPESSQSPLDEAMIDHKHVKTLPAISSHHKLQVAAPTASFAAIQSSSDKAKTDSEFITTSLKTSFSGNTESNARQSTPSLSAPLSPASSLNIPVLPSSLDLFVSIAAAAPYAAAPRPETYTHQFMTSSIRTPVVRKCGRCVAGYEFKTCRQSVCDECIKNGRGSPTDVSILHARLREELDQLPISSTVNATTGNRSTGNTVIDYDSDATISNEEDEWEFQ
ncbi:uncharacterized protein EAE97_000425 [Botrytis byssoidea]|uniref:Uncharacterized protein n=1 Tax=Botrytis byssoidea TaxID=139641 RepID=A0A9P5LZH1_9HELO|nr:uncharacterized protein EAE97_000425 [Botrytis byssoidea]KAF7955166.1 hypothetical protein EAE97_000425 [Botrytis byssoidea]